MITMGPYPDQDELRRLFWYANGMLFWKAYKEHRLIWIWHHGAIPGGMEIDHLNGGDKDNRIENLRLATRSANCLNRKDADGVSWCKTSKRWIARAGNMTLGRFNSVLEAQKAYADHCKPYWDWLLTGARYGY